MTFVNRRIRTLAVLIAALGALFALAGPAQAKPRGFQTGLLDINAFMSDGSGDGNGSPLAFQRTKAAGSTYVKTNLYWSVIAPAQPPSGWAPRDPSDPAYSNWGPFDNFVRQAKSHGLEPILDVVASPVFAQQACTGDPACSPRPSDYADFAAALAKRYSGGFTPAGDSSPLPRVKYFQAWVEPNLNFFYKPTFKGKTPVAPENYRGILNAFSNAIKSVDSSNQVISAGLAPLARPGATIGPLDFMRRLLCLKGSITKPVSGCSQKTDLDIWAMHPYTTGGPTHKGPGKYDIALGNLPTMSNTLKAADRLGKIQNSSSKTPFWVTEFSWDSNPPDKGGLKAAILDRWVAEAMYRMYSAGVDTMIWFNLRDEAKAGRSDAVVYQSGLYLRGGTLAKDKPKPVLNAFKFPFVALTNGKDRFHFWGRTAKSTSASIKIQVKNGRGGFKTVATSKANASGIFQGNVHKRGLSKTATVRAIASGQGKSIPFSLKYVKDFYQPPFGGNPNSGGPTSRIVAPSVSQTPRFWSAG